MAAGRTATAATVRAHCAAAGAIATAGPAAVPAAAAAPEWHTRSPPHAPRPSLPLLAPRHADSCLNGACQECQADYSYYSYCSADVECCNGEAALLLLQQQLLLLQLLLRWWWRRARLAHCAPHPKLPPRLIASSRLVLGWYLSAVPARLRLPKLLLGCRVLQRWGAGRGCARVEACAARLACWRGAPGVTRLAPAAKFHRRLVQGVPVPPLRGRVRTVR